MKHEDYCTHVKYPEEKEFLTSKLFDVNMRLFESAPEYRAIVRQACDYLRWWCQNPKEGYKAPHGVSGANAGIPWNIIAYNRANVAPMVMINPKILKEYGKDIESESNCGSLTLKEPIKIVRKEFIDIEFYDTSGFKHTWTIVDRKNGGLTIQHEVDHNLGILITDRQEMQEEFLAEITGC